MNGAVRWIGLGLASLVGTSCLDLGQPETHDTDPGSGGQPSGVDGAAGWAMVDTAVTGGDTGADADASSGGGNGGTGGSGGCAKGGEACLANGQCCSFVKACVNGKCCTPSGDMCSPSGTCCSGTCTNLHCP